MTDKDIAVTWLSEADRKRDLRRQKIANLKWSAYMWWHGFYWYVLHSTRLARPYSRLMCRLNLYRTYHDGRCQWCGKYHGSQTKGVIN